MMNDEEIRRLVTAAVAAKAQAYVPYSGYAVGAALLSDDGQIFAGCNVENASYSLTICAERNAVFQAVARGVRAIRAVAVVSDNGVTPCGACRQVLAEFNPRLTVIVADLAGEWRAHQLSDLLPDAFGPEHLPSAGGVAVRGAGGVAVRGAGGVAVRGAGGVAVRGADAVPVQKP
jgi:cytidine deaminase